MATSTTTILGTLRKLIIDGELPPGERLAEVSIAERLGVSRTPVRMAFRTLAEEGLLQPAGKRGYMVREFSDEDIRCAVEVRGVLEGLAARRLAELGVSDACRAILEQCLEDGEDLLAKGYISAEDVAGWSDMNVRFHTAIIEAGNSTPIADAIARNNHLPFASFDSLVVDTGALEQEYQMLRYAHVQHRVIVEALVQGEGARAEMLMREHAYVGQRYGHLFGGRKLNGGV